MQLQDQLDELRINILRDRSDLIAGDTDSFWTDDTLLRYIGDAERRFARRTLILRDSTTPEVVQFKLKNGVTTYPLHASIIAVLSAKYDTDVFDLQRSGHGLILQYTPPEFLSYDPTVSYTVAPGRPIAFYTDETLLFARQAKVTFSVYPPPGTDQDGKTIALRTIRMPLSRYTQDDLANESELPEDYQLDALEWAAYRALRGFDADAGAPTSAEAHKQAFEDAVAKATSEAKLKMFANLTVKYGSNGFGYVR
jgi:hypothetical protein